MTETQREKDERLADLIFRQLSRNGMPDTVCHGRRVLRDVATDLVRALRNVEGVTIEPPPLPEKTYSATLRQREMDAINSVLRDGDPWKARLALRDLQVRFYGHKGHHR